MRPNIVDVDYCNELFQAVKTLVAVSGPIYPQSFAGKSGKVETYAIRANNLEMLKRKNANASDVADEAVTEVEEGKAG